MHESGTVLVTASQWSVSLATASLVVRAQARAQMTGWQATSNRQVEQSVESMVVGNLAVVELADDYPFEVPAGDAQATSLK